MTFPENIKNIYNHRDKICSQDAKLVNALNKDEFISGRVILNRKDDYFDVVFFPEEKYSEKEFFFRKTVDGYIADTEYFSLEFYDFNGYLWQTNKELTYETTSYVREKRSILSQNISKLMCKYL